MVDSDEEDKFRNFHEFELDDRILKAVAKLGWLHPTLIQEKAIPLILEGKDVLIRARTGSGKTAAFAIPVIQKILNMKQVAREQSTRALVLAPTKELCTQIHRNFLELTNKCSREVNCVDISTQVDIASQRPLLVDRPDIVVGTPSRALMHLKAGFLKLKDSLDILVIDEADLVFSFGYENDMKEVLSYPPGVCQTLLSSATLTQDVVDMKKLLLHNPVVLKLQEPELPPATQLSHYHISAEEQDKAAILYALLKLHLIRGRSIIFVNTVDKCYRLKLFLEQFGIPACVLNSELPAVIRCHSVSQFSQGLYDIIIVSDERALENPKEQNNKPKSRRKQDKESGVARGIDFQCVSNVINFDFPCDVDSYIHRVGRTARGSNEGTALSFVNIKEQHLMKKVEEYLKQKSSSENDILSKSFQFKLEEVEGFRYRARDAWKAVTRISVREARLKEIKQELLNSQKLKSYFEDNPRDLQLLRHDKALHTVRLQPHLCDVPEYLVPPTLKKMAGMTNKRKRFVGNTKPSNTKTMSKAETSFKRRNLDPLISMEFPGFKNKK